jgi:hypothetical protein
MGTIFDMNERQLHLKGVQLRKLPGEWSVTLGSHMFIHENFNLVVAEGHRMADERPQTDPGAQQRRKGKPLWAMRPKAGGDQGMEPALCEACRSR